MIREKGQWLRACIAPAEDLSFILVPISESLQTPVILILQNPVPFSALQGYPNIHVIHKCIHTYTRECENTATFTNTWECEHTDALTPTWEYEHTHSDTDTHRHIHTEKHTYIDTHSHTDIYTQTHTHKSEKIEKYSFIEYLEKSNLFYSIVIIISSSCTPPYLLLIFFYSLCMHVSTSMWWISRALMMIQ